MKPELLNIAVGLFEFGLFTVLQALFINGVKGAMEEGMILQKFPAWSKKVFGDHWSKAISGCSKCMASVYGTITYWPCVLWVFGFEVWEVPIFIADVFIVSVLNFYFYKKL